MVQDSQRQRIEAAQADMLEQEASKRRVADFVRQSRPGYATDDAAADSEKRLAADGWKRGAFGGHSRDTGDGTESFSVGGDRISYGYMPKQQPSVHGGGPNAATMRQGTDGTGMNPGLADDSIYSQMREVQGRIVEAEEAHRQVLNDGLLAAMRFAADTENNGRLPRSSCELLSRQFGMDGVRAGVLDAGYVPEDTTVMINGQKTAVKKGSFGITLAQKGQDGNMVYTPMFLSPSDVYAVMSANRSVFSDEQIAARRDALLGMGYSSKELDALVEMSHFMDMSRGRAFQSRKASETPMSEKMKIAMLQEQGKNNRFMLSRAKSAGTAKNPLAESLGLTSDEPALEAALKRINDKNFLAANQYVTATQADVDAGLAKKVGDSFVPTREYLFERELAFYKKVLQNSDPAVNADSGNNTGGGQQPLPGNGAPQSTDQPSPDGGQPQPEPKEPQLQNGGKAAPGGSEQGELDFGQAAPEETPPPKKGSEEEEEVGMDAKAKSPYAKWMRKRK